MKKHIVLTIILLFACTCFNYASPSKDDNHRQITIVIIKNKGNAYHDSERTEPEIVKAYYDRTREEVTFDLYNIGTATLYIIDSRGEIVDETTVETDVPTKAYLSTALARRGEFMVAVCSEYIYAEGYIKF